MLVLDLCAFKVQDSGYVQLRLSALFIALYRVDCWLWADTSKICTNFIVTIRRWVHIQARCIWLFSGKNKFHQVPL